MKPRRWFQIHLSTAVVVMFAASGLLGLNFHTQHSFCVDSLGTGNVLDQYEYGWPASFLSCSDYTGMEAHFAPQLASAANELSQGKHPSRWPSYREWNYPWLAMDAVSAFSIVGIVIFVFESLIRRREARTP